MSVPVAPASEGFGAWRRVGGPAAPVGAGQGRGSRAPEVARGPRGHRAEVARGGMRGQEWPAGIILLAGPQLQGPRADRKGVARGACRDYWWQGPDGGAEGAGEED